MLVLYSEYQEYLRQLNNRLKRSGLNLPVNFDCDNSHIYMEVTKFEQFLYFNHVLQITDSEFQIPSLFDFQDIGVTEFLRNQIYAQYEAEWNQKMLELTQQPANAGVVDKPVSVIPHREMELFTESLGLVHEEEKEEEKSSFIQSLWQTADAGASDFEFDDDEEEEEEEDFEDYSSDDDGDTLDFDSDDDDDVLDFGSDDEDEEDDLDFGSDDEDSEDDDDLYDYSDDDESSDEEDSDSDEDDSFEDDYSDLEFHRAILDIGPAPFHIIENYLDEFNSPQT